MCALVPGGDCWRGSRGAGAPRSPAAGARRVYISENPGGTKAHWSTGPYASDTAPECRHDAVPRPPTSPGRLGLRRPSPRGGARAPAVPGAEHGDGRVRLQLLRRALCQDGVPRPRRHDHRLVQLRRRARRPPDRELHRRRVRVPRRRQQHPRPAGRPAGEPRARHRPDPRAPAQEARRPPAGGRRDARDRARRHLAPEPLPDPQRRPRDHAPRARRPGPRRRGAPARALLPQEAQPRPLPRALPAGARGQGRAAPDGGAPRARGHLAPEPLPDPQGRQDRAGDPPADLRARGRGPGRRARAPRRGHPAAGGLAVRGSAPRRRAAREGRERAARQRGHRRGERVGRTRSRACDLETRRSRRREKCPRPSCRAGN